jgi:hypothetical protein
MDFMDRNGRDGHVIHLYRTCFKNWIWADAKALAIQRLQVI